MQPIADKIHSPSEEQGTVTASSGIASSSTKISCFISVLCEHVDGPVKTPTLAGRLHGTQWGM